MAPVALSTNAAGVGFGVATHVNDWVNDDGRVAAAAAEATAAGKASTAPKLLTVLLPTG